MLVLPNHAGSCGHQTNGRNGSQFQESCTGVANKELPRPIRLMSCKHSRTWQLTEIGERPNITATTAGQRPTLI